MKKIHLYIIAYFSIGLLSSSCIKDRSGEGNQPISKIEVAENPLKELYIVSESQAILNIASPKFSQENQDKTLSYEWFLQKKANRPSFEQQTFDPISRERDLSYTFPSGERGIYEGLLKVSNGDSFYIQEFEVKVPYPYEAGLYALLSEGGKSKVFYFPEKEISAYVGGDKEIDLSTEVSQPISKIFFTNRGADQLYLLTGGYDVFRLSANEMKKTTDIFSITKPRGITNTDFRTNNEVYLIGNKLERLSKNSNNPSDITSKSFGNTNFFGEGLNFADNDGYANGIILFDNEYSQLLVYVRNGAPDFVEIFGGQFANQEAVSLNYSSDNKRDMVIILKDKTTNTYKAIDFYSGTYKLNTSNALDTKVEISEQPIIRSQQDFGTTFTDKTVFATAPQKGFLYYSKDNEVFNYILGSNSIPSSAEIIFPNTEKVVNILIDKTEERFYVATYDRINSKVYSYDISENIPKQLWVKEVSGKIQQLDYRYTSDVK